MHPATTAPPLVRLNLRKPATTEGGCYFPAAVLGVSEVTPRD